MNHWKTVACVLFKCILLLLGDGCTQTLTYYVEGRSIYKNYAEAWKGVQASTPTGTVFWREQDLSHWLDLKKDCDSPERVIQKRSWTVWCRPYGICNFVHIHQYIRNLNVHVARTKQNRTKQNKTGEPRSTERIREIPEYSGKYRFPVISWKNRLNKN